MLWVDVRSASLDVWAKERNRDPMQLADRINQLGGTPNFNPEGLATRAASQYGTMIECLNPARTPSTLIC